MGDRPDAVDTFGNQRLDILNPVRSGGRITNMPDPQVAWQLGESSWQKHIIDQAQALVGPDASSIADHNSRALLSPMLKRK
jgi:hypothetical protein